MESPETISSYFLCDVCWQQIKTKGKVARAYMEKSLDAVAPPLAEARDGPVRVQQALQAVLFVLHSKF